MYPTGIVSSVFLFSDRALQWLCGTTTDDGGRTAGNFTLLGDLLARMALTTEEAKGFRRPLMLSVGQAQYSEEQLSAQWNIGRKRIRNLLDELTRLGLIDTCRSRVASVMTFPCIRQWTAADGSTVSNPLPIQTKGKDRTNPMADRPDSGFLLFPNPETVRHLSVFFNGQCKGHVA